MRSKLLTIDFYRKWCEDIYGPSVWPFVSRTNNEFGGLALLATNLYMTNGDEGTHFNNIDPWKWASLQTSNKAIISKTANCTNCAHCVDLRAPNEKTDSK